MWSSLKQQTPKTKVLHTLRCRLILKDPTLLPLYTLCFHSLSVGYKQDLWNPLCVWKDMPRSKTVTNTCYGTQLWVLSEAPREVYFSYGFFLTNSAYLPSSSNFIILSEPWTIPSQLSIIASIHSVPFWSHLFWQLQHKVFATWTQAIQGALFFFSVGLPVLRSYLKTVSPWHTL